MAYLVTYRPEPFSSYVDRATQTRYTQPGTVKETESVDADYVYADDRWIHFYKTIDPPLCRALVRMLAADSVLSIAKI